MPHIWHPTFPNSSPSNHCFYILSALYYAIPSLAPLVFLLQLHNDFKSKMLVCRNFFWLVVFFFVWNPTKPITTASASGLLTCARSFRALPFAPLLAAPLLSHVYFLRACLPDARTSGCFLCAHFQHEAWRRGYLLPRLKRHRVCRGIDVLPTPLWVQRCFLTAPEYFSAFFLWLLCPLVRLFLAAHRLQ